MYYCTVLYLHFASATGDSDLVFTVLASWSAKFEDAKISEDSILPFCSSCQHRKYWHTETPCPTLWLCAYQVKWWWQGGWRWQRWRSRTHEHSIDHGAAHPGMLFAYFNDLHNHSTTFIIHNLRIGQRGISANYHQSIKNKTFKSMSLTLTIPRKKR